MSDPLDVPPTWEEIAPSRRKFIAAIATTRAILLHSDGVSDLCRSLLAGSSFADDVGALSRLPYRATGRDCWAYLNELEPRWIAAGCPMPVPPSLINFFPGVKP